MIPRPRLLRATVVAIALLEGSSAIAATPRVRITYTAPEGCPDEASFVAAIGAQSRPFERASPSAVRVRSLDAAITRSTGGFSGVLRVKEADGKASERAVRGAACDDVTSALALVAAITIDTGPLPPSAPPPEEPEPPIPSIAPRWGVAAALHGGAFFAMTPSVAIGVSPQIEVSPPVGTPFEVRLGFTFAAAPRAATITGSADFYWLAARVEATPLSFTRAPLAMGLVFGADAGAVLGRGVGAWLGRELWRPWLDLAVGLRGSGMLTSRLGIELSGGMLVPITRDTWVFERPLAIVHQTPPVGAYVTVGIRALLHP